MDYKDKVIKLLMSKELTEEQKSKLLDIFPELKESEDERIRKYLKHIIGEWSYDDLFANGFRKEDIIAWLEKQGELTHSEPTKESDQDVQNSGGLQPGIKQIFNLDISKGEVIIPDDIDKECIDLCVKLSSLPHITTTESCCGHLKDNYRVFFECDDFAKLGMLFRCVNRNYSDGKWRIEVDGGDVRPSCQFMLTSKLPFSTYEEMADSVNSLIENIDYWNDPKYDDYFLNKK